MRFKQFFLLLLLAGTAATAQSIALNTTDKATGSRQVITKNHVGKEIKVEDSVAKYGLLFFSAGYQSTIINDKTLETYFIDLDMFHHDNKLGCINQLDNNVEITLEDGTQIECFQISDTECDPESYKASFALTSKKGSFADMTKNFKKLQTVAISKILIKTTEGRLLYKIRPSSKDDIKAHFALVAKTLNAEVK